MNVSVLIPCYNAAPYIAEALESVFSQIPAPEEVIVVDDGSTDDSAEVVRAFDPRVRFDQQPHRGIGATRNRALQLSSGNLIAFLDADDVWPASSLQCRVDVLQLQPTIAAVFGLTDEFVSPELSAEARNEFVAAKAPRGGRVLGATLMRRSTFDVVGLFDAAVALPEIDWWSRAAGLPVPLAPIDAVVLRRRLHPASTGALGRTDRSAYLRVLKAALDRRAPSRDEVAG